MIKLQHDSLRNATRFGGWPSPSSTPVPSSPVKMPSHGTSNTGASNAADSFTRSELQKKIVLLKAAAVGDLAGVNCMLAQGADVNTEYDPVMMGEGLAADADIVKVQLRWQKVDAPNYVYSIGVWEALPPGSTALILASRAGNVEIVQRLLAEPSIDCNKFTTEAKNRWRSHQTALHWASRLGCTDVVRALLSDKRVDLGLATVYGFTAWGLAVQQGHLAIVEQFLACPRLTLYWAMWDEEQIAKFTDFGMDVEKLKACDCWQAFHVVISGGSENRLDVVRRCMQDERIRRFYFDPGNQCLLPRMMQGLRMAISLDFSPAMLAVLLESGFSPNESFDDGATLLDDVVKRRMVEHTRVLLLHNAESTLLTPVKRAQLLGDALQMRKLVLDGANVQSLKRRDSLMRCEAGSEVAEQGDYVPALHRMVLQGDNEDVVEMVRQELRVLQSSGIAHELLDEGKLPAAFYAVELGHLAVAQCLFKLAYGFQDALVDELIEACRCGSEVPQGERSFRVCCVLIESEALEHPNYRVAALSFLKTWCSSLIATRFLEKTERFEEFRQLCWRKNDGFYKRVDDGITISMLAQAACIAADARTEPVRQDDEGIIPPIKFYRELSTKGGLSFDHEAAVAMSFAYLGQGLESAFEKDIENLFHGSPARVVTVAPKSFQRMQNKMLNPAEHGDERIAKPRCAKNVDVLRGCIIVQTVSELEAAFSKLQEAYEVVRVKNTHHPSTDGFRGGYRSLLVNFVYKPGVTWAQLFGGKITFDLSDFMKMFQKLSTPVEENCNHLGDLWLDWVEGQGIHNSFKNLMGLQGLQVISSEHPEDPVRMIVELQLVLEPYFEGRAVSHMLFKIGRCDTGAMEMVRDFFQEFFHKEARQDERLVVVRDIALAVKEGRPVPERATATLEGERTREVTVEAAACLAPGQEM